MTTTAMRRTCVDLFHDLLQFCFSQKRRLGSTLTFAFAFLCIFLESQTLFNVDMGNQAPLILIMMMMKEYSCSIRIFPIPQVGYLDIVPGLLWRPLVSCEN
jgi:hypothetical protein